MSAPVLVNRLQHSGVALSLEGDRIIADGPDSVLTDETIDAIRQLKPQIRQLLQSQQVNDWDLSDWKVFFDERAGIAEFDGGQTRTKAEERAFQCCVVEWLNRHLEPSDPGHCAWCGSPDRGGHVVVPFGTESHGHTWLHPGCWGDWHAARNAEAVAALASMGIQQRNTHQ